MKSDRLLTALLWAAATLVPAMASPEVFHPLPKAPPPSPPPIVIEGATRPSLQAAAEAELHSIGDPTPEEQLYLEFMNRSRANPAAEGQILYHTTDKAVRASYNTTLWEVDLKLMNNQFASLSPAPPLAMNAKLTAAARKHTQDMFSNIFQGHNSTGGGTLVDRINAEGYIYQRLSENVFSYAESVFHGHAGFEVDWGPNPDGSGMQPDLGHRVNIHNPVYTEVGIGVVLGTKADPAGVKSTVGPLLVTQDFGTPRTTLPYITGVAYYDLNGNNFYDLGEGIGGVQVSVSGVPTRAVTARSGGYALPVPGDGNYTVSFTGADLPAAASQVVVQSRQNVKVDFKPAYSPPLIGGPVNPVIGKPNLYTITPVGSASLYRWRQIQTRPAPPEPAESNAGVTLQITGNYAPLQSQVVHAGASAFRLLHLEPASQTIALNPVYLLGPASSLSFASRLGISALDEVALVQISVDEGVNWTTLYSQPGGTAETAFSIKTIPLGQFSGKDARFRLIYQFEAGQFFPSSSVGVGWHIDEIQFQNVDEIIASTIAEVTEPAFTFTPSVQGSFGLQARARAGHEFLPWTPPIFVQSHIGPPEVAITAIQRLDPTQARLDFKHLYGGTPASYSVESKSALDAPWVADSLSRAIHPTGPGTFSVTIPLNLAQPSRFYRVRPNLAE